MGANYRFQLRCISHVQLYRCRVCHNGALQILILFPGVFPKQFRIHRSIFDLAKCKLEVFVYCSKWSLHTHTRKHTKSHNTANQNYVSDKHISNSNTRLLRISFALLKCFRFLFHLNVQWLFLIFAFWFLRSFTCLTLLRWLWVCSHFMPFLPNHIFLCGGFFPFAHSQSVFCWHGKIRTNERKSLFNVNKKKGTNTMRRTAERNETTLRESYMHSFCSLHSDSNYEAVFAEQRVSSIETDFVPLPRTWTHTHILHIIEHMRRT